MGRRRTIILSRLLLLLLTLMDFGPLQITASTLPSTSLRRQKKSIMDLQLSSLPSSLASAEEDDDELEDDDNESVAEEASMRFRSDEDDDEEEDVGMNGWPSETGGRSSFRERQVANLLNPIATTISKRSARHRKPLNTFFSERERDFEERHKRQKKQHVAMHPKSHFVTGGPDPARAHRYFRLMSRRNPATSQQNKWHSTPSKIPQEVDIDDNTLTILEKKSSRHPNADDYYINYYYDDDDDEDEGDKEEDFGLKSSSEDEEKAIDAALKHLSWQRLTKRLIQLEGLQGPYLDRGERSHEGGLYRRTLNKRSSSLASRNYNNNSAKKELEALLSDDNTAQKLKRSYTETTKKASLQNDKDNLNKSKSDADQANTSASNGKISSTQQLATTLTKQGTGDRDKGRYWVPYDSERTLRSKKSWDRYFGYDKRSAPPLIEQDPHLASHININLDKADDDETDEEEGVESEEKDEGKNKLQDDVIKWYFDKVLSKSNLANAKPLKLESKDNEDDSDDKAEEGDDRKKKSIEMVEVDKTHNEIWTRRVDNRLRQMEDALLVGATRLLEKEVESAKRDGSSTARDGSNTARDGPNKTERDVISHLKAAFSLEKMRDALEEFEDTIHELDSSLETPPMQITSEEDDKKRKMKKKSVGKENRVEDEVNKRKKKSMKKKSVITPTEMSMAIASSINNGPNDLSSEVASPVFLSDSAGPDLLFPPPCPLMIDALEYCEQLSGALGEMGKMLSRSCVQHMLCYTCDKSPSTCNRGFLREVEELCDDDFRCQAIAGAMRSVFLSNHDEFRRRNSALCDADQCLARLLQK